MGRGSAGLSLKCESGKAQYALRESMCRVVREEAIVLPYSIACRRPNTAHTKESLDRARGGRLTSRQTRSARCADGHRLAACLCWPGRRSSQASRGVCLPSAAQSSSVYCTRCCKLAARHHPSKQARGQASKQATERIQSTTAANTAFSTPPAPAATPHIREGRRRARMSPCRSSHSPPRWTST